MDMSKAKGTVYTRRGIEIVTRASGRRYFKAFYIDHATHKIMWMCEISGDITEYRFGAKDTDTDAVYFTSEQYATEILDKVIENKYNEMIAELDKITESTETIYLDEEQPLTP